MNIIELFAGIGGLNRIRLNIDKALEKINGKSFIRESIKFLVDNDVISQKIQGIKTVFDEMEQLRKDTDVGLRDAEPYYSHAISARNEDDVTVSKYQQHVDNIKNIGNRIQYFFEQQKNNLLIKKTVLERMKKAGDYLLNLANSIIFQVILSLSDLLKISEENKKMANLILAMIETS